MIGFLVLAPALPFAFGTIAWSSYAERYIYLSSAFWILAIGLWAGKLLTKRPTYGTLIVTVVAIVCSMAGFITFSRNEVWKTNVALMNDTVAQNPKKRVLHDIYIRALLNAGMNKEAEQQYRYASTVAPAGNDISTDLGIGEQLVIQKRYFEALQFYQEANYRTRSSSEQLLSASIELLKSMQLTQNLSQDENNRMATLEYEYRYRRSEVSKSKR